MRSEPGREAPPGASPGGAPDAPLGLVTDLYELVMAQSYLRHGMLGEATFCLFVRRLPAGRPYLLACGLESLLDAVDRFRFTGEDLDFLDGLGRFDAGFLDWLGRFRFTGTIRGMAEGTPFFADEPLVEVDAPLPEAQVMETLVMNQVHHQTTLASKAAMLSDAARGTPIVDFGLRRTHGIEAGVLGARAQMIGGIDATSNLAACRAFGLSASGTMAHSYVQAHEDEGDALARFAADYPDDAVLLVDTYDTLAAVDEVIRRARAGAPGFPPRGIRLDSGDLGGLARACRDRLDAAGFDDVRILASGGLDEDEIRALVDTGAPIDGFGVGTGLGVSRDAPALDMAFKLVAYDGRDRMKLSSDKQTVPGGKQVFRRTSPRGEVTGDLVAGRDEEHPGTPLLCPVHRAGRRLTPPRQTAAVREAADAARASLPEALRTPSEAGTPPAVPVRFSAALEGRKERLERVLRERLEVRKESTR